MDINTKCAYHLEIESVGTCLNCGRFICRDCQTIFNGKSYCKECIGEVLSTGGKASKSQLGNKQAENWFERHLNWTLMLGAFAIYFAEIFIAFLLGAFGLFSFLTPVEINIIFWLFYFVLTSIHVGWYLRKKKRSLFWIFLWFVPIGWIILLCLTNKSEGHYDVQAENERIEQGRISQENFEQTIKTMREKFPNRF